MIELKTILQQINEDDEEDRGPESRLQCSAGLAPEKSCGSKHEHVNI